MRSAIPSFLKLPFGHIWPLTKPSVSGSSYSIKPATLRFINSA